MWTTAFPGNSNCVSESFRKTMGKFRNTNQNIWKIIRNYWISIENFLNTIRNFGQYNVFTSEKDKIYMIYIKV